MSNKINNEETLNLIKAVQEYPVIYDRTIAQNNEEKNAAWLVKSKNLSLNFSKNLI